MTTNEQILCPVCGERMKIGFYADNMECTGCELELPRTVMKAIQSRIDKEKAAAVQQERERVINILELAGKKWDWTDGMRILIEEIITGATK